MSKKIKELFRRYETGKATENERRLIEAWFRYHEEETVELNNRDRQALKKLDQAIGLIVAGESKKDRAKSLRLTLRPWQSAAIWIGLCFISMAALLLTVYHRTGESTGYVEHHHAKGAPVRYILPDSSVVYLGAGSSIRYPTKFEDELRSVDLDGEAFFNVKTDSLRPFSVQSHDIQTKVLGTSFKIEAFYKDKISVSVATGKVAVSKLTDGKKIMLATLTPGRRVTWNDYKQEALLGAVNNHALEQWQSGDLVFDEEPLEDVLDQIERRFGLNILILDEELSGNPISTMFSASDSLDQIFNILSTIGKFKYTKTDKTYKLTKAGGE